MSKHDPAKVGYRQTAPHAIPRVVPSQLVARLSGIMKEGKMPQIKVESFLGHVPDDRISEGFEKCTADAMENFEKNGEAPFFVAIIGDQTNEVIQWSDGGIPYDFIKQYFAGKARAYYACFESWYVETKNRHIGCMPSEHPDRKEAMIVVGESRDGWYRMAAWDIIRNGGGVHLVRIDEPAEIKSVLSEVLWEGTDADKRI